MEEIKEKRQEMCLNGSLYAYGDVLVNCTTSPEDERQVVPDVTKLSPRPEHLDDYALWIKITLTLVSAVLIVFSVFAIVALNRTRRTPAAARFLSSGLIVYDILAVTFFCFRRFVVHHGLNIVLQVIGVGFCYLAYITIGIMSLERLILFHSPNFYLQKITPTKFKTCIYCTWLVSLAVYYTVRFGVCFATFPDQQIYAVVEECNKASFSLYGAVIITVIMLSYACYARIYGIVKADNGSMKSKPHTFTSTARSIQQYKATSIVFVYLVTITTTSIGYSVIIALGLERAPLRISNDLVNIFNCMADPCMYVLWFSECKMEIFKMFSKLSPKLIKKIEQMRMDIFHVVTIDTSNTPTQTFESSQVSNATRQTGNPHGNEQH